MTIQYEPHISFLATLPLPIEKLALSSHFKLLLEYHQVSKNTNLSLENIIFKVDRELEKQGCFAFLMSQNVLKEVSIVIELHRSVERYTDKNLDCIGEEFIRIENIYFPKKEGNYDPLLICWKYELQRSSSLAVFVQ